MAPVPPNTCASLYVDYVGPFHAHTMKFDFTPTATLTNAIATVTPLITALAALQWNGTIWNIARWRPAGSAISTPTSLGPITSASGFNPVAASTPSAFNQLGGRSVTGVRAKFYLFEVVRQGKASMRYVSGADATVDAAITALVTAATATTPIVAADNSLLAIYPYANVGQNDYWTHRAR